MFYYYLLFVLLIIIIILIILLKMNYNIDYINELENGCIV